MAKKEKMNYASERRALISNPPGRLYLLWGEEDYLRESYYSELAGLVFPNGDTGGMSLRRLDGQPAEELVRAAVETLPFFTDRTLVELRGFNPNKCAKDEAAKLTELFADIPDYCTLAILPESGYDPDGRLSIIKAIKKEGTALEFTSPDASQLVTWIRRRCEAEGKNISRPAAEHLVYMCSPLINRLKPEIEKLAAFEQGGEITVADIDAVVERLPETRVFELTDCLAARDYDGALARLAELLSMKEQPVALLAMIGAQFRRLYAARLAMENRLGESYVRDAAGIRYDFLLKKLMTSAGGFTLRGLQSAIMRCAECDYKLKSTSMEDEALLSGLILSLASYM